MIRRVHKKVRSGCSTCKRRRIKCDEERPMCRNCKIHGAACIYEFALQPSPEDSPGQADAHNRVQDAEPEGHSFNARHMMLLHHFTTSTAATLHSNVELKRFWREEVPPLAFSSDCLLYSVLAVSSLHLASITPDDWHTHWTEGISLHQWALASAKIEMQAVTDKNRDAVFLFSALTCYFALARSQCGGKERSTLIEEYDFMEWALLFRGTRSLISIDPALLENGRLAPMINIGKARVMLLSKLFEADRAEVGSLAALQAAIQKQVTDPADLRIYEDTLHLLKRSFYAARHPPQNCLQNTDIFAWLFDISNEFMAKLESRHSIAIALFGCFGVLCLRLRGVWWVGDWGDWVLNQTYDALKEDHWLLELVQSVVMELSA